MTVLWCWRGLAGRDDVRTIETQVSPCGIDGDDERDLFDAQPAFDFFLASNRAVNIFEALEVHEAVEFVFRRKARTNSQFVLAHSPNQPVRYAGVQRLRAVRHDVDEIYFG
jgi:hypothetical protein